MVSDHASKGTSIHTPLTFGNDELFQISDKLDSNLMAREYNKPKISLYCFSHCIIRDSRQGIYRFCNADIGY